MYRIKGSCGIGGSYCFCTCRPDDVRTKDTPNYKLIDTMHNYTVNASLQIIPIVQDKHPYEWVDEAIAIIQHSNVKHEVGAFATTLEGNYLEVMKVINEVNEYLFEKGCAEWISNIQIQIRSKNDITVEEKTEKFHK